MEMAAVTAPAPAPTTDKRPASSAMNATFGSSTGSGPAPDRAPPAAGSKGAATPTTGKKGQTRQNGGQAANKQTAQQQTPPNRGAQGSGRAHHNNARPHHYHHNQYQQHQNQHQRQHQHQQYNHHHQSQQQKPGAWGQYGGHMRAPGHQKHRRGGRGRGSGKAAGQNQHHQQQPQHRQPPPFMHRPEIQAQRLEREKEHGWSSWGQIEATQNQSATAAAAAAMRVGGGGGGGSGGGPAPAAEVQQQSGPMHSNSKAAQSTASPMASSAAATNTNNNNKNNNNSSSNARRRRKNGHANTANAETEAEAHADADAAAVSSQKPTGGPSFSTELSATSPHFVPKSFSSSLQPFSDPISSGTAATTFSVNSAATAESQASSPLVGLESSLSACSLQSATTNSSSTVDPDTDMGIKRSKICGMPVTPEADYVKRLEALCHPEKFMSDNGFRFRQFTEDELARKRKCKRCMKSIHPRRPRHRRRGKSTGSAPEEPPKAEETAPPEKKEPEYKCKFHPQKMQGRFYTCCGGTQFNNPCFSALEHDAQDISMEELYMNWGLFETKDNPRDPRKCVALDCEMGVSQDGDSELIRVTAIDYYTTEVLLDKLVFPVIPMAHLNTRYSGVSWPDLNAARRNGTALLGRDAARNALLQFVDKNTIVVGHSVNHDLMALRWIHHRVVDTLLLDLGEDKRRRDQRAKEQAARDLLELEFALGRTSVPPPPLPPPEKEEGEKQGRSLKALSLDRLGRVIQTGEHDSLEDTLASRDLLNWWVVNKTTTPVDDPEEYFITF